METTEGVVPDGHDGKIQADDDHGIGDDCLSQIEDFLHGGLIQGQPKERLVPLIVSAEDILKENQNFLGRGGTLQNTPAGTVLQRLRAGAFCEKQQDFGRVAGGRCEISPVCHVDSAVPEGGDSIPQQRIFQVRLR